MLLVLCVGMSSRASTGHLRSSTPLETAHARELLAPGAARGKWRSKLAAERTPRLASALTSKIKNVTAKSHLVRKKSSGPPNLNLRACLEGRQTRRQDYGSG